jgi:hypothetical protein
LVNNYNYIYSENKRLQEDINNKNSQISEIKELLNINNSCENNNSCPINQ